MAQYYNNKQKENNKMSSFTEFRLTSVHVSAKFHEHLTTNADEFF